MTPQAVLQGTGVFPDVAVGRVILLNNKVHDLIPHYCILEDDVLVEEERFLQAITQTKEELEDLKRTMAEKLSATHLAIFDAHILFLNDSLLTNRTIEFMREERCNAEYAFNKVMKLLLEQFSGLDDPYFKDKREDLQDIARRVIHNLLHKDKLKEVERITVSEPSILVSHVIHPSDLKLLSNPNVVGIAALAALYTHNSQELADLRAVESGQVYARFF